MFFSPSGVRLRQFATRPGVLNWLFLPGGPGIGSDSLAELVEAVDVPGSSWLVDLPGDGSNTELEKVGRDPYRDWPHVLIEAAHAVANPVFVGHSTGGMYLLSVPELEPLLKGLALVDTAPDACWMSSFVTMADANPLPAVTAAVAAYERERSNARLADLTVASAPWNFSPSGLLTGTELLARLPYNRQAVDWSEEHFDHVYRSTWWPESLPTLIVSGSEDRIVTQVGWDDPQFTGDNVMRRTIAGGGHFPWIENPSGMHQAFTELSTAILDRVPE